jgi:release factor glutamine methyltransferase
LVPSERPTAGAVSEPPPQEWTVASLLRWATDDFRARGIESPRLDAELIVGHVLKLSRMDIIRESTRPLESVELVALRALVKRRRAREPIAYLRRTREFYGREFAVDKRVLIPRPDTEILVEVALKRTAHRSLYMRALDLFTGSGCIATTLACERRTSKFVATDICSDALVVAQGNALRLGAYNASFRQADIFSGLLDAPPFDLITANPPYIPSAEIPELMADVRDFEPRLALDGGHDGLVLYRRLLSECKAFLEPGGLLVVEVGAGEAPAVKALFDAVGFCEIEVTLDYGRVERVVSGVHRPSV